MGSGLTYDSFGRITSLSAADAGGKTLTTSYFANDMVASQSQNGVTNTFQLDATLRQRQRLQGGGIEGTEVFHYDGPGDSPAWTERGSTWTRNIVGLGGELAAVQESGQEITLQLTNLHGDVSATAAINPAVTSLKSTSTYDEFGNPTSGSAGRYGWLGGKQRRTELPSGVIQMGVRDYIPAIGRFLSTDPVNGGSANSYDYADADPVNGLDLAGTCARKRCRPGRGSAGRRRAGRVSIPGPNCTFSAVATDETDGTSNHITVTGSWSCTKKTTAYAWTKYRLPSYDGKFHQGLREPKYAGNARTGHFTIREDWAFTEPFELKVCVKFFYARQSVKACKIVDVVYS